MPFTYRNTKGSELSYSELDENFQTVEILHDSAVIAADSAKLAAQQAVDASGPAVEAAASAQAAAVSASKLNLGTKSAAPVVDNQGAALLAGATYYDTTLASWRLWNGTTWVQGLNAPMSGIGTSTIQKPETDLAGTWPQGLTVNLNNGTPGYPAGVYSGLLTIRPWTVSYGTLQINHAYNSGVRGVWYRQSTETSGAWTAWAKLLDDTSIHAAPVKAVPVDLDELALSDSAASWGLKKLTWAAIKASFSASLLSTANLWTGLQTFQGLTGTFKGISGTFLEKGTVASGAVTFIYADADHQRIQASGNITLSVSGWPAVGKSAEILLECINFGGKTITWPVVNWVKSDGTFSTTASANGVTWQTTGTDFVLLWTRDGGATVYGKVMR